MKSTNYKSIDVPIKLHLEFKEITMGELSNILRHWQALLRSAWRESFALHYQDDIPNVRILVVSTSAENSIEFLSDFAISLSVGTALLGPVRDWPAVARTSYHYVRSELSVREGKRDSAVRDHVYLRGGTVPKLVASEEALRDREVGQRIERLWEIANSGAVRLTVEEPNDEGDESESE